MNVNVPSSTYSIQKMLNRVPCEKFFAGWLVIRPADCGELLCRLNYIFCMLCLSHSALTVSSKAIMRKRKSTGATLSPCFTPTSKVIEVSILPIINLALLLLYIRLIAEHSFGGQPYLRIISIKMMWFKVSKALTRSANMTHVGRLWLWRKCSIALIVKLTSWHPTPGVEPNWYLTPCSLMMWNNRVHRIELNIFEPRSISVTPRHLLGSLRSPIFGTGITCPSCH